MNKIRVHWSEGESAIDVSDVDELERILDDLDSQFSAEGPTIVFVEAHGCQVSLGLGYEESFVHFEQVSGDPPYFITVGNDSAEGVETFYLFGVHHTEIPRRNLVRAVEAREVLRECIRTAVWPRHVKWEEV